MSYFRQNYAGDDANEDEEMTDADADDNEDAELDELSSYSHRSTLFR